MDDNDYNYDDDSVTTVMGVFNYDEHGECK